MFYGVFTSCQAEVWYSPQQTPCLWCSSSPFIASTCLRIVLILIIAIIINIIMIAIVTVNVVITGIVIIIGLEVDAFVFLWLFPLMLLLMVCLIFVKSQTAYIPCLWKRML